MPRLLGASRLREFVEIIGETGIHFCLSEIHPCEDLRLISQIHSNEDRYGTFEVLASEFVQASDPMLTVNHSRNSPREYGVRVVR